LKFLKEKYKKQRKTPLTAINGVFIFKNSF